MFIHFNVSLFRLMCLSTCLDLVKRCCLLYKDLVSFTHIFQPIRTLLSKHLPVQTLPELLQVGVWYSEVFLFFKIIFFFPQYLILSFSSVCCFVAGASQGDPGDHQQCSCDSQSAGFGEEEAYSSEAAHAEDRWSVSKKFVFHERSWVKACKCATCASVLNISLYTFLK